jgi:hypothetical protein
MSDENKSEPLNILLSREELSLVLSLLQANTIPGIDTDPLGEMTEEQQVLASIFAGRALRARELARVKEDGELAIHAALLTAVGVCAYAQNTIFAYHWTDNGETFRRYFGHVRGDDIVAHTRPEDVLHLFTLIPSKEQLVESVLAFCEYEDSAEPQALEMIVPSDGFAQARELADAGDAQAAVETLTGETAATEIVQAFVDTLVKAPRVSVLQTLKQEDDETVRKRDFTIVQNGHHSWFIIPVADEDEAENQSLLIKSTTRDEVQSLLTEWV